MQYSDEKADDIIRRYGLKKERKYTWKWLNNIPDMYSDPAFNKDQPLDERLLAQQSVFLTIIQHPLIKHSGFDNCTDYKGKLDEMLTLRRGATTQRKRSDRVSMPSLNLARHELESVVSKCRSLVDAILLATARRPYYDKQNYINNLFRNRAELTRAQALEGLEKKEKYRWLNYYYGKRGPLELHDAFIIEHIQNKLIELLYLLESFIYYGLDR